MNIKFLSNAIASIFLLLTFQGNVFAQQSLLNQEKEKQDKPTIIHFYKMTDYERELNDFYKKNPDTTGADLEKRLMIHSQQFLQKPYQLGPLGEGPVGHFNQNPLYRTDVFDCQTYVETVLALVESNHLESFNRNIIKIRYFNDSPSFATRNHFTSVDWNPHNQKNGYIEDVTQKLFPNQYKTSTTLINRPAWFEKLSANSLNLFVAPAPHELTRLLDDLHAIAKEVKPIKSKLDYVPLTTLFNKKGQPNQAMFKRIPSASIIEIVRPNWNLQKQIGTNLDISHLGFAIRVNGVLMYREASSIENKVIDIPLADYLAKYLNSSTVKGIHIEAIKPNYALR